MSDEATSGAAGAASNTADAGADSEAAKLRAELAEYKRKEADAAAKAKKAETEAAKANGELGKVLERYEADLAAAKKAADDAASERDGLLKASRQKALTDAVAAKLGVPVGPILIGLLPQTGEDIAPDKITDAHVGKIAESIRKMAPDLKPNRTAAPGVAGGSVKVFASDEDGWRAHARRMAGRE